MACQAMRLIIPAVVLIFSRSLECSAASSSGRVIEDEYSTHGGLTLKQWQDLNVNTEEREIDLTTPVYYDFLGLGEHSIAGPDQSMISQSANPTTDETDPIETGTSATTNASKKPHYLVSRELGFARARMSDCNMKLDQWYRLLDSNDPQAMEIKAKFAEKSETDRRFALLQKKLRNRPQGPDLLVQLEAYRRNKEDFMRQRHLYETKRPMSKLKRDRLIHLLAKFRMEIEQFKVNGTTKKLRDIQTLRRLEAKKKREATYTVVDKYSAGDSEADAVAIELEKLRKIFHESPMNHEAMYPHWLKVDAWMRVHKDKYVPLDLPTEWPNLTVEQANDEIIENEGMQNMEDSNSHRELE